MQKFITWKNCHEFIFDPRISSLFPTEICAKLAVAIKFNNTIKIKELSKIILDSLSTEKISEIETKIGISIKIVNPNSQLVNNIKSDINNLKDFGEFSIISITRNKNECRISTIR